MEAKELMIGDWVEYSNIKVMVCSLDIKNCEDKTDDMEYTPIPLNAEILLANGFKSENGLMVYVNDNEPQRYAEVHFRHNGNVRSVDIRTLNRSYCADVLESMSVSEFQHALRLCGFIEIADNFRIE